jgi:hypothetical protein
MLEKTQGKEGERNVPKVDKNPVSVQNIPFLSLSKVKNKWR